MLKVDRKIMLGWLSGIIDGEGCVGLYNIKRNIKGKRNVPMIIPVIAIVNTNIKLINEIESILDMFNIVYYTCKRKSKNKNWKPSYNIDIRSKVNCKKLLNLITDHLVIKKNQAEIVLEFCNKKEHVYSERIKLLPNLIYSLNKKGLVNQT